LLTTSGVVEGDPSANGGLGITIPANVIRTNHAFLDDIAHNAVPVLSGGVLQPDADTIAGNPVATDPLTGARLQYDNELLDAHFATGDGRGNENIGLTAVHHIFHAEHNRLVNHIKDVILASNDATFIQPWLLPGANQADGIQALEWNGERLFQAARFGTEMQYQHLVFEEFARTVQPQIDLFFATTQVYDTTLNPAIVDEFAHVVYRFGHSMLTETVDRYDPNFNIIDADPLHPGQDTSNHQLGLIAAFLNPLAFAASGANATEAAGAIVRGMTRQVGNEIDEFVTEALRNNLVGLPLDLPSINIARGRDTGVPSLNAARKEFYNMTGDAQLAPYTSWVDFAAHLKHEESVINFIAAYGTHPSITSAATTADKRTAALAIVTGEGFAGTAEERLAFLNGPAVSTGVDDIDLWIGGLAEKQMPFGGLLGSTFNFVFETQLEKLQDGDRFYYLERTGGLNFLTELEGNSFAKLVMANTDATHLPGAIFTTPTFVLEVDQTKQFNAELGSNDPTGGSILNPLVTRDPLTNFLKYAGADHVVMGGTPGNDIIIASIGDDTLYGDGGNDRLDGGDGVDMLLGGDGDDIITDLGGDDVIQGGEGNDAIQGGNGINLVIGGFGQDFINSGEDASEVFGGPGNDFILGSRANEQDMGNEGDDWIEHGNADGSPGDNFDPFGRDPVVGNDVYIGDTVVDIMNAEGGDDIMVGNGGQQDHYLGASGFDWAVYKDSPVGVIVSVDLLFENEATALGANPSTLDRYQSVEGISGSQYGDILIGSDSLTPSFATSGFNGSILTNIDLIDGLRELLPAETTSFTGEILLGGAGSDLLKGGWGDEIIDGDGWLNVQIGVYDDLAHTSLLSRHNSMLEIQEQVFAGLINPGQLGIIREIRTTRLNGTPIGPDFDTAVFSDVMDNYTIETLSMGDNGTPDDVTDDVVRLIRVTDIGTGLDGVDLLWNVERLQFADQALVFNGFNGEPEGLLTLNDDTPTEDQLLSVSISGVTDSNNPDGNITGPVTYYWQVEGTSGIFTDILIDDGVTTKPVTGETFRPTDFEIGFALRVRAVYKDASDVIEEVFSAPTAPVIGINDAPVGTVLINDTTPTETQALVALIAFTDADAPVDLVGGGVPLPIVYNYQWQQANDTGVDGGSAGFTNIAGATAQAFTPTEAQVNRQLRVVVSYIDDQGTPETITSAVTTVTGIAIPANAAAQMLTGTAGQDLLFGGDGADTLMGLGEADLLDGGAGNDTLDGGAGNDTVLYTLGQGVDVVLGGSETDTLVLTGTAGHNVLDVVYDGSALTTLEGGTLTSVEAVRADLRDGTDTLSYIGTTAAVTVDLSAGTASGFTTIASVENAVGGAGNDTLTGQAGANVLNGGLGNDTLTGGAGNDTLTGGAGNDTLDGGAGADTFLYTLGQGVDVVLGGSETDTLGLTGTAGHNVLDVVYDGSALTTLEGGTLTSVEAVRADLRDGTDTLSYIGTTAAVTVDLSAGTASGFTAIASVENAIGGAGNDTLTGQAGANVLNGGLGNDTLTGGAGNDTLIGGAGNDVFVLEPLAFDNTITDFNANPAGGGQDLLNIAALGITAATFATAVNITAEATGTMIDFGDPAVAQFHLVGVNAAAITAADFILAS
jgi:Ca2+-binding RTX toxin-like protein